MTIGPKGIGPKGFKASIATAILLIVIVFSFQFSKNKTSDAETLKVLSYSSFLASWGPGPEIAKLFKEQTGIEVIYQDADDAGLLLTKLELFPSDVVVGLDSISSFEARAKFKWKPHGRLQTTNWTKGFSYDDPEFVAFDWAPLTFIYRKGEITPPINLDDLLDVRFKNQISLQDPRTSAPGLQFLYWLVAVKGEDQAFEFLNKLRPNIRAISPSWSTAYGLFQKGEAKLAFSYVTSPAYHWANEKDLRYQASELSEQHIYQVELAAIPEACINCRGAKAFVDFLGSDQAQEILMNKNIMYSVDEKLNAHSKMNFDKLPALKVLAPEVLAPLIPKKKELIERWKDLKL